MFGIRNSKSISRSLQFHRDPYCIFEPEMRPEWHYVEEEEAEEGNAVMLGCNF